MTMDGVLNWLTGNIEAVVAIVSALVAVVSALIARGETRAQRQLQQGALRLEIDRQSLDWGNEVIDVMADAGSLANGNARLSEQEFCTRQCALAARLSALADRGRLFFPNYAPGTKGQEKEGAYQGHRPPILFAIIIGHYQVKELRHGETRLGQESANFLFQLRRLFVSELQAFLDPNHRNSLVERASQMDDETYMRAARLALDFECRHPGVLAAHQDEDIISILPTEERRTTLHEVHERLSE